MDIVLSILGALLVLGILVFVHELGHYGMGRLLGFKIVEFAIGMGPKLAKFERKGILYSIRALPIGGMCQFEGEDEGVKNADSFNSKPVWKRMLVVLAGPLMNILFAIIFSAITLMAYGDLKYMPQVVDFDQEFSIAQDSGMLKGDIIVEINGTPITYPNQAVEELRSADPNGTTIIVVDRAGERVSLGLSDIYNAQKQGNYIGITIGAAAIREEYGFFSAWGGSVKYTVSMIDEMFGFLGTLFQGNVQQGDVVSAVGMIDLIGQAVRSSFETVLRMAVLISINLGIINLLPLPALDGGRFVFMGIEAIFRKPVPVKVEAVVHMIGFALLMVLMIVLTFGDISRLVGG